MKLDNSSISTRGAGQFPEPNAINEMSWLVPTVNIYYPSNHARGAAQIPQAHAMIDNSRPQIEGAGPYSAFNLSLDKHHVLMESEKLAWQLVIDPINGFIDEDKEATRTEKASAQASRIEQCREQFEISALKNADPSSLVGTSDAAIGIDPQVAHQDTPHTKNPASALYVAELKATIARYRDSIFQLLQSSLASAPLPDLPACYDKLRRHYFPIILGLVNLITHLGGKTISGEDINKFTRQAKTNALVLHTTATPAPPAPPP